MYGKIDMEYKTNSKFYKITEVILLNMGISKQYKILLYKLQFKPTLTFIFYLGTFQTEMRAKFKQLTCHFWKALRVIQEEITPELYCQR